MKIGEFSKRYGVNKETVRYYTDIELLIPEKVGNYYDYDQNSIDDMDKIIELKEYGFSLNEILKILTLLRIAGVDSEKTVNRLSKLMEDKRKELVIKKLEYEEKIINIDKFIKLIGDTTKVVDNEFGLSLKFLNCIACPNCQSSIEIHNSKVRGNGIIEGGIACKCGYKGCIKEGIVISDDLNDKSSGPHNRINGDLSNVNPNLISLIKKTSNYIRSELHSEKLADKIILDLNADIFLVTRYIVSGLPSSTMYIVTGETFNEVKIKRYNLSRNTNININNIMFVVSDGNIPIKHLCVDILIDSYATSFKNIYSANGIIENIKPYLGHNSKLIGAYFGYKNYEIAMKNIKSENAMCFTIDYIVKKLLQLGIESGEKKFWGKTKDTGHALAFHNKEDFIYIWTYKGYFNIK
ncbi:MAG: MerR family transcriptional regulator [Clostridium sp.]